MSTPQHQPPADEVQKYLIATANRLAADEKERLHQTGKLMETQEEFAAFHKAFFEKLGQQVKQEMASTTDTSLAEHAIPEEVVATKVSEFLEDADGVLPIVLPAKVVALPRRLVRELWDHEIRKRRMKWREEGKKLVAAEIQKAAEVGKDSVEIASYVGNAIIEPSYLEGWGAAFPNGPASLPRSLFVERRGVLREDYESLVASFQAAGYNVYQTAVYQSEVIKECSYVAW